MPITHPRRGLEEVPAAVLDAAVLRHTRNVAVLQTDRNAKQPGFRSLRLKDDMKSVMRMDDEDDL